MPEVETRCILKYNIFQTTGSKIASFTQYLVHTILGIMAKWWIGCSGFHYKHWKGIFYPEKLA
jgi:hypothetical protein